MEAGGRREEGRQLTLRSRHSSLYSTWCRVRFASFLRVYVVITACAYPGSTRARGVPSARVTWLERVTGPRFCSLRTRRALRRRGCARQANHHSGAIGERAKPVESVEADTGATHRRTRGHEEGRYEHGEAERAVHGSRWPDRQIAAVWEGHGRKATEGKTSARAVQRRSRSRPHSQ